MLRTHNLHRWTITSGFLAPAARLVTADAVAGVSSRCAAERVLHDEFGMDHSALQVEADGAEECELPDCSC